MTRKEDKLSEVLDYLEKTIEDRKKGIIRGSGLIKEEDCYLYLEKGMKLRKILVEK